MNPNDALLTIAEIAIATIGFAGIVSALRPKSSPAQDAMKLTLVQIAGPIVGRIRIGDIVSQHPLALAEPVHAFAQNGENVKVACHASPKNTPSLCARSGLIIGLRPLRTRKIGFISSQMLLN